MSETRIISYESEGEPEKSFPFRVPETSFRIDALGIKRLHQTLLKWSDVQTVQAWITSADGDWGIEEHHLINIIYITGERLYVNDVDGMYGSFNLFDALWENLPHFLPSVAVNWKDAVLADYHQHLRRQDILNRFSFSWYPNKPVIYRK
ncbi:hypothetical protein [uncultured Hymenobacter sp.]|uniref:hypothetical protein n=1 Tax=uncultured Hymenobacter sp. TaxID=170016 RepID=UPI0035CB88E7